MSIVQQANLSSSQAANPEAAQDSIFFVGTATVLLRFGGFTILTDPNFLHAGGHVHLGYGLTAERLTNPALDIEQLPPLDFCVLSHYHGDHFDQIAEERLQKDLPILTTEHAASELKDKGFTASLQRLRSLQITFGGLQASCFRCRAGESREILESRETYEFEIPPTRR